jgi:hypothetical protein
VFNGEWAVLDSWISTRSDRGIGDPRGRRLFLIDPMHGTQKSLVLLLLRATSRRTGSTCRAARHSKVSAKHTSAVSKSPRPMLTYLVTLREGSALVRAGTGVQIIPRDPDSDLVLTSCRDGFSISSHCPCHGVKIFMHRLSGMNCRPTFVCNSLHLCGSGSGSSIISSNLVSDGTAFSQLIPKLHDSRFRPPGDITAILLRQ